MPDPIDSHGLSAVRKALTITDPTDALLSARGRTHGDFTDHARCTVNLKSIMEDEPGWSRLSPPARESLHMIAHKIGRILAGDPDFPDHWDDIAGYARLVSQRCTK